MKCKGCKKNLIKTTARSNNQKFCSVSCRNKYYLPGRRIKFGAKYQRDKREKELNKLHDLIPCVICGRKFKQPGSHIVQMHQMTAREYREIFGFDVKRGQLVPDLRELKAKQAIENETYKNLKAGKRFWFIPNDPRAGHYPRSKQTLERLKSLHNLRNLTKTSS